MYCNKCGRENNNTNKFCISCGKKLETNKVNIEQSIKEPKKTRLGHTTLSLLSLIFCILQFVISFIASKVNFLEFLNNIPFILISLVLAIISRCIYKDTMSLVMIIIDSVLMVLMIIGIILLMIFFVAALEELATGCSQLP